MSKRLAQNLNSLYVEAANRLRPKQARRKIVAYVESYDDVFFWRTLLNEFENDRLYFQVMLPSSTSLAKGKKSVLMNNLGEQLGQNMIACVDSDYDYLLQGATSTSRMINQNRFVFQTYTYAIENYLCYAGALHEVCVMATLNDREIIDLEEFMRMYSRIAYPLFVWSVWFYRKHRPGVFSLLDFCEVVRLDKVSVYHLEVALHRMERRVNQKLHRLEHDYPKALREIEALKKEMRGLGVTPDNTYLFIQGHHIMDNVVLKILAPLCVILRRERENEIRDLAEHDIQFQHELTCYQRSQSGVDQVIRKHTYYKDSPFYDRIRRRIATFLEHMER